MGVPEHPNLNRLLATLRHAVRRQILKEMIEAEPTSPGELAGKLDLPLTTVAYHVRVLSDHGALELVDTKEVRGSVQHFYRAAIKPRLARRALELAEPPDSGPVGEEKP